MESDHVVPPSPEQNSPPSHRYIGHWVASGVVLLIILALFYDVRKLASPGAPIEIYAALMGTLVAMALILIPAVFSRAPRFSKAILIVGLPLSAILLGSYSVLMKPVWDRTPEGKREVAEHRIREIDADKRAAEESAENAKRAADDEASARQEKEVQKAAEQKDNLEGCLSWGGEMSVLSEDVKARLHNPHSFEHVRTDVVGPDSEGMNVEMVFRAENGFGALRTGSVRAEINPDSCELVKAGQLYFD